MADIDELSSDSDDEEYVPEGGAPSSGGSDASEGEPEEALAGLGRRRSQRQAKDNDQPATRKRQTRLRFSGRQTQSGKDSKDDVTGDSGEACEGGEGGGGGEAPQEEKNKSRIDDLWASFKRDTEVKSQRTPSSVSKQAAAVTATGTTVKAAQGKGSAETNTSKDSQSEKMIKVKQIYDFAGEEVEVEKEVAADSTEAKAFLQSQSQQQQLPEKTQPISLTTSAPAAVASGPLKGGQVLTKGVLAGSKRRSSGLSSVLQSIGKKPKLSTLEKSHLDWQKYKREEDLEEELTQHNKDGYLAKQEFLQRADLKQFELEREERLKRFRRMY